MSRWNHALCERCWGALQGERVPARVIDPALPSETCCRCGVLTHSGIFYRADPADFEHCAHSEAS